MKTNCEQTTKKKKKKKQTTPYPITSTTPWSSESSSKTKEMGSHSLSLAMILTCCRPCLSNVYLNSFEKKGEQRTERRKHKNMFSKLSKICIGKGSIFFSTTGIYFKRQIMFQFLFLQLRQQLLHQTKCNRLSSTECLQRRTPSSSTMLNLKVNDKRKNEKHLVVVFLYTENCR